MDGGTSTCNVHGCQAANASDRPFVTGDQRLQDVELGGPSASAECLTILSNRDSAAHRRQPCSPAAPACRAAQLGRVLSRSSVAIVEGVHGRLSRLNGRLLRRVTILSRHSAACCSLSQLTGSCLTLSRSRTASKACLGLFSGWVGSGSERSGASAPVSLSSEIGSALASCTRPEQCSRWSRGSVLCASVVVDMTVGVTSSSVVHLGRKVYHIWET